MRKKLSMAIKLIPVLVFTFAVGWPKSSAALTTSQLVLSSSGSQANIATGQFDVTPNGKFILFESGANYIVSGDTNNVADIFVRDTANSTTARVSVASDGSEANGASNNPFITRNGRFVLFHSTATNLATVTGLGSASYTDGTYLRDTKTNTTYFIAASTYTYYMNVTVSVSPDAISEDGRFVYYEKAISGSGWKAYLLDRQSNTTQEISTAADGTTSANGHSTGVKTSCDGRFAAFQSVATNLVASDNNSAMDVFLVDSMNSHSIKNITLGGNGSSSVNSVSCDGNFVTFTSDASNLVSGDTNSSTDVFIYDVANDNIERVSLGTSSAQLSTGSNNPQISADGRYVLFNSSTLVGSNYYDQVYRRDRFSDTTTLVSKDSSGQSADSYTQHRGFSFDGQKVFYISTANNLGVSNPNNAAWYLYTATDL